MLEGGCEQESPPTSLTPPSNLPYACPKLNQGPVSPGYPLRESHLGEGGTKEEQK